MLTNILLWQRGWGITLAPLPPKVGIYHGPRQGAIGQKNNIDFSIGKSLFFVENINIMSTRHKYENLLPGDIKVRGIPGNNDW